MSNKSAKGKKPSNKGPKSMKKLAVQRHMVIEWEVPYEDKPPVDVVISTVHKHFNKTFSFIQLNNYC